MSTLVITFPTAIQYGTTLFVLYGEQLIGTLQQTADSDTGLPITV